MPFVTIKRKDGDFPGGPAVKNLPSNAGDVGSWSGTNIPRAAGRLSPGVATKEPTRYKISYAATEPSGSQVEKYGNVILKKGKEKMDSPLIQHS